MRLVVALLPVVRGLLPEVGLFLDLRMTIRSPADAMDAVADAAGARPDGVIMWESADAPDYGAALDGLTLLAVDPGARNVAGLPAVRPRANRVSLYEPPFDAARVLAACGPGANVLIDSTADVWAAETLPLVEVLAAAAVDARLVVSLYDEAMLAACCEKLVLGALAGASAPRLGEAAAPEGADGADGADGAAAAGSAASGVGVALPPDAALWRVARTYRAPGA